MKERLKGITKKNLTYFRCFAVAMAVMLIANVLSGCASSSVSTDPGEVELAFNAKPTEVTELTEAAAGPAPTQPAATQPASAQSPATEPAPTQSPAAEPAPTQSPAAEPAPTQPAATQPAPTQSPAAEPAPTQPAATQPAPTQPAATQPAPTQSPAAEPAPTLPPATEPAPTQPLATEPAPTQPTATEPAPTEPAAADHVHDWVRNNYQINGETGEIVYAHYRCTICGEFKAIDFMTPPDTASDIPGHTHTWTKIQHDEDGYWDCGAKCQCGWTCYASESKHDGDYSLDWIDHINSSPREEWFTVHISWCSIQRYILITPAYVEWVCTECGETHIVKD